MDCCENHKKHEIEESHLGQESSAKRGFSWWWCLLLIPVALAVIYLFKIPLGSLLPWGVFLLCPLMHIFMMKGHGDHGEHGEHKEHKKEEKG